LLKLPDLCRIHSNGFLKRKQGISHQTGVTLIEVMISVTIFAIALLATFSMVISEWAIVRKTQEQLYVTRILESRLEELRDLTFVALTNLPERINFEVTSIGTVTGEPINPELNDGQYQYPLDDATGQVIKTQVAPDLFKFEVRIRWKAGGKPAYQTMQTITYIAKNGVSRT